MQNLKKISIIIPAYNEEHRIGKTLEIYSNYYEEKYNTDFEILVILNGCKDNTESVVKKIQLKHSCVRYLNYVDPIGKGGAIVKGLENTLGDLVGFTDADGSTRPNILDKLFVIVDILPNITCAIGSRNLPGSIVVGKPKERQILTSGFNFGVNFLFNLGIKDTQCGAKVIRRDIVKKLLPTLTTSNMAFDINMLVDIKKFGGDILEVPINWEDDNQSSITRPVKTSVVMALSVVRLWFIYSPIRFLYPIVKPINDLIWILLLEPQERKFRKVWQTPKQ